MRVFMCRPETGNGNLQPVAPPGGALLVTHSVHVSGKLLAARPRLHPPARSRNTPETSERRLGKSPWQPMIHASRQVKTAGVRGRQCEGEAQHLLLKFRIKLLQRFLNL